MSSTDILQKLFFQLVRMTCNLNEGAAIIFTTTHKNNGQIKLTDIY